jgi:hypothetical protein
VFLHVHLQRTAKLLNLEARNHLNLRWEICKKNLELIRISYSTHERRTSNARENSAKGFSRIAHCFWLLCVCVVRQFFVSSRTITHIASETRRLSLASTMQRLDCLLSQSATNQEPDMQSLFFSFFFCYLSHYCPFPSPLISVARLPPPRLSPSVAASPSFAS